MIKGLKTKISGLGIGCILLLALPVQGFTSDLTSDPASGLTLTKAVETAVTNNPGLEASGFQILSAQEKILQARSGMMPQVNLTGQANRTTNPMWAFGTRLNQEAITSLDFDPARLNNPDPINNYSSSLAMTWPVYDSGQTWYGLQQAELGRDTATLFSDRTRQQVIAETTIAYLGVLVARENQIIIRQVVETALSHLKLVQSRYNGGFVAKSDLLRAQVHIADLEQQLTEAISQTDISKCRLNVAMGVTSGLDYGLATPLEAGDPMAGTLESWITTALANRPDLKQLALQKSIAQKEIDKSRAARTPMVSLIGNYEINSEDFQDQGSNYTIGAVASLPLFSGGRISSKIREAQANLKQTQAMLRQIEQQICAETRQAFLNARSAWERIGVAQAAVSQSQESLRIVKNRYNSGLFTITDLLDADVMVQQSMTNYLKAVHGYRAAATYLALATGTIDKQNNP